MREYENYFIGFNASMRSNEQEVTAILNANAENIKSEIKKLENQIIETATRLLTSYQIFLNQAKESANNEINTNKTASLEALTQAKTNANNEINTNKQEALNNITQEKQQATNEITEAKKTAFNELLNELAPKVSGLYSGIFYIRNTIYIQGGWESKIKDLSDYTLDKNKKYEIEVFFIFLTVKKTEIYPVVYFGLKTNEGFLKESIEKIQYKYMSQIYYKKLLVENVSGVLGLYHGYFYGNINYFNESIITSIKEIPNDTIISKVYNGTNFTNATMIVQNLNDTNNT